MKNILLVNPWIYDFAAYDLWLKPWGLLKISSILKKAGFNVYHLDLLDRHHPLIKDGSRDHPDGTGKYIAEEVRMPGVLQNIPRKYKRYGLPAGFFKKALPDERIDAILVSSGMTYWYPGVFEAIRKLKDNYPGVPVVLGGTYATLSYEHALEKSGADHVVKNNDLEKLSGILGKSLDLSFQNVLNADIDYDGYKDPLYGVLRLSLGCPFNCSYCAQKKLSPVFMLKDKEKAIKEITMLYGRGIRNFAFYDDALLFDSGYISRYLKEVTGRGIRANFYTPNGLHARFMDRKTAKLLKKANFLNPVLSLEIANDEKGRFWHDKVSRREISDAVTNLKEAGYKNGEYMVYLMLGAPGCTTEEVEEGARFIHSLGAKISLSEFSPIPGTAMAEDFKEARIEPLLQNNSIFPSFSLAEWESVQKLKDKAKKLNSLL
ncbi:MAG: radical SAM protein [Candidatus Omnitrophota bacterium]|jgi:radical SAM superfamily enzyme YgiQ (UPF0313 family)